MTEMYSGVIPLNMSDDSRGMFFVFQPRVGPPVKEITIWFNGGPGEIFCGILFSCCGHEGQGRYDLPSSVSSSKNSSRAGEMQLHPLADSENLLLLFTGCSSLEGFLQENGRIQWSWGQY